MDRYDEFKKAYNDYPSQDNEGFIPDRGGFKCGFNAAWDIQQKEIDDLKSLYNEYRNNFTTILGQREQIVSLHSELDQLKILLEKYVWKSDATNQN